MTDEGLRHIGAIPNLKFLWLRECIQVDGSGLRYLERIETLNLTGPIVRDETLVHLDELKRLERLFLNDTVISPDGVRHLNRMESIRVLSLVGRDVTDEFVGPLTEFDQLEMLLLLETSISDSGFDRLRASLPRCSVEDR